MCMDPVYGTIYTHQRSKVWVYKPYRENRYTQFTHITCIGAH